VAGHSNAPLEHEAAHNKTLHGHIDEKCAIEQKQNVLEDKEHVDKKQTGEKDKQTDISVMVWSNNAVLGQEHHIDAKLMCCTLGAQQTMWGVSNVRYQGLGSVTPWYVQGLPLICTS
jgi:hypothetical protein